MLKFNIITLFPQLFTSNIELLPFKRAIEKNIISVNLVNLRDFAIDKHGTVDDTPYGGGTGMLLMIEPIYKALKAIHGDSLQLTDAGVKLDSPKKKIIALTTHGTTYTQKKANDLARTDLEEITFICGRYEGLDARVEQYFATDLISVGNFVVSGGEVPTLLIMESITRLLPGVLEKEDATTIESFNDEKNSAQEFPQYTRPADFMGLKVPEILLSGDHAKIAKWRNLK